MTDPRTTPREGVYFARLVESPVETSAIDRRYDYVAAPRPRPIVMRPTTHTQFVVTSAIDLRDDVLRDEVPGIIGDACHGIVGGERDAIVQAIEQEDTQPLRRVASGTTPPAVGTSPAIRTSLLRGAAERRDVAAVREILDEAEDDALAVTLARGSSPSLERPLAISMARGSVPSLPMPRMTLARRGEG